MIRQRIFCWLKGKHEWEDRPPLIEYDYPNMKVKRPLVERYYRKCVVCGKWKFRFSICHIYKNDAAATPLFSLKSWNVKPPWTSIAFVEKKNLEIARMYDHK